MLVVFVKPLYRVQPKCLFMYARHYYAHSQTYNYTQLESISYTPYGFHMTWTSQKLTLRG
jgi:hypothetical protein